MIYHFSAFETWEPVYRSGLIIWSILEILPLSEAIGTGLPLVTFASTKFMD